MKENKNVQYKARLWVDEKGELHGLSFANRQVPTGLLDALNKAMHEVVDSFNGKTAWKENYIKFTDNGKRYEQFDGEDANTPCKDCVFSGKHCQHPHYYDGSKGYCGKPYREVKEKGDYLEGKFEGVAQSYETGFAQGQEIGEREMADKACKWLTEHTFGGEYDCLTDTTSTTILYHGQRLLSTEFRKAMGLNSENCEK